MVMPGVTFAFFLQLVSAANGAELSQETKAKLQRQAQSSVMSTSEPSNDLYADLFPGDSEEIPVKPVKGPQSGYKSIQPTYESWDVLRQYPRYEALPEPSKSEPKERIIKNETKENNDV